MSCAMPDSFNLSGISISIALSNIMKYFRNGMAVILETIFRYDLGDHLCKKKSIDQTDIPWRRPGTHALKDRHSHFGASGLRADDLWKQISQIYPSPIPQAWRSFIKSQKTGPFLHLWIRRIYREQSHSYMHLIKRAESRT